MNRIVSWFSCGAASAVATKLAISESKTPVEVVYCHVKEEHPDNLRFMKDCEKWFGQKITVIENKKYNGSIYEVFTKRKYIAGIGGAPCTVHLKKDMRKQFERPDDVQIFGYTVEEQDRLAMYKLGYQNNNCIGCVKGGMGYWTKIRVDFPEAFDRMALLEKTIGAKILKHRGERIWLADLPKDAGDYPKEQAIECGIFCHMAEESIK